MTSPTPSSTKTYPENRASRDVPRDKGRTFLQPPGTQPFTAKLIRKIPQNSWEDTPSPLLPDPFASSPLSGTPKCLWRICSTLSSAYARSLLRGGRRLQEN